MPRLSRRVCVYVSMHGIDSKVVQQHDETRGGVGVVAGGVKGAAVTTYLFDKIYVYSIYICTPYAYYVSVDTYSIIFVSRSSLARLLASDFELIYQIELGSEGK